MNIANANSVTSPTEHLRSLLQHLRKNAQACSAGVELYDTLDELTSFLESWPPKEEIGNGNERREKGSRNTHLQRLRYQDLFRFAPDGYIVTDREGIILEANHAAAALLQTPLEFLAGKPFPFFIEKQWRPLLYDLLCRTDPVHAVESWETVIQTPRGIRCHVALTSTFFPDDEGQLAGYRWMLRDITVRKQVEQKLREEKELADSLVSSVEAVVLVVDKTGRIVRSNPFLETVSGCSWTELAGEDWGTRLIAMDDQSAARAMIEQAYEEGFSRCGNLRLIARDGSSRLIAWSARALHAMPHDSRLVVFGIDMTELHEAQQRALEAKRLAAIGELVAGLAHESRNALQRSQSCLSLLGLRLTDNPEITDLLFRMQQAQDDLHRLFETVRGYAGPIRLDTQRCWIDEVWREAWADLSPPEGKAALREEISETYLQCTASPFHLKQVFRNLFDNAMQAVEGPVLITVHCSGTLFESQPAIRITVRDNGPGLTAEQRNSAFQAFFTTKTHGTGLGLAICQRIVEAHGGSIGVGENTAPGAEFVIILPRRSP